MLALDFFERVHKNGMPTNTKSHGIFMLLKDCFCRINGCCLRQMIGLMPDWA